MNRSTYPAGPAFLTVGGITIEMAEDWKLSSQIMKSDMKTNLHGVVGASEEYVITKITGKPVASSTNLASLISYLYPYNPDQVGTLVMGTDQPAVIQTRDGKSITYPASFLSKMPDLTLAANTDIFGEFEITCLRAYNGDPTAAASTALVQASAYTAPSLDPLTRIRSPYTVAWGSTSPFNAIEVSKAGVKFSPSVKLTPVEPDLTRLINYRIESVDATAKFTPLNLDADDFYNFVQLASANAGVGKILGARGQTLTVQSTKIGDPLLTIPLAVPDQGPLGFDTKSRVGEVTLQAYRKNVSGALQSLFTLAARTV